MTRGPLFFQVPAGTPPTQCRGPNCRREKPELRVYWITTGKGKRLVIDCTVPGAAAPTDIDGGQGVAHFATCPDAIFFRKARRG